MLANCAQNLFWVCLSWDKAPGSLISKCTLRFGLQELYLKIGSPKIISEHNPPTLQALPLDRHPTRLCLDVMKFSLFNGALWVESPMFSVASQVSLLRRHRSHSFGQLFSLSLVEAEDGWSWFSLSKAGQLIQQWWLPWNFWVTQSQCSLLNENNF